MMKKKLFAVIMIGILVFELTGCGIKYPDLKDNAIAFMMGEYIDEKNDDDSYGTIEYKERTYMPYGTINYYFNDKSVKECIGYIIQDENSSSIVDLDDKDTRVYTLKEDPNENYLMEYYIGTTLMNQPSFGEQLIQKEKRLIHQNILIH